MPGRGAVSCDGWQGYGRSPALNDLLVANWGAAGWRLAVGWLGAGWLGWAGLGWAGRAGLPSRLKERFHIQFNFRPIRI